MTISVMQPYIFPYIGYFQLVNTAEKFVFFNDVNFIKKGWINRNNILQAGKPLGFTVPLIKASQNKKINEIQIADYEGWRRLFLRMLEFNYKRAPFFNRSFELIKEILYKNKYSKIDELASESITAVSAYINLQTNFLNSETLCYSGENGQEKIISICKIIGASKYINPKNGAHLYSETVFNRNGIELTFLECLIAEYKQFGDEKFIPSLSIIDLLMFNSPDDVRRMTNQATLFTAAQLSL